MTGHDSATAPHEGCSMIQACLARRGLAVWLALAAALLVSMQLLLALRPGAAHASAGSAWPRPTIPPLPASEPGVATPSVSLDGTWSWTKTPPANFYDNTVDPSSWTPVPIPGDLAYLGLWTYCDEPCTTDKNVEYPYKKSIAIPASFQGREIIIRFEAAQTMARVWANGHLVTTHRGAFSQWDADITPYVTPGGNAWITIGLTMEDHSPAFRHVRGITRDVTMIALPKNYATRLQATTTFDASYTDATLAVTTGVSFTGGTTATVKLRLTDPSGADVPLNPGAISLSPSNPDGTAAIPVAKPKKWDAEHPYLYTLTATYNVDGVDVETVSKQIGFRTIVVSGNQLLVNGHPVKLHGADYLPDSADKGINVTTAAEDFHNLQEFKNANINYIRTSHMAPSEATLDAADKLGIYVEYETSVFFVGQGNGTNTQSDAIWLPEYVGQFAENIAADQTHPSILYWSLGNENTVWGSNMQAELDYVRQADPTRPTKFSYGYAAPTNSVDIYSVHYPGPGVVGLFTNTSEPVINDEYAHGFAPPVAGPAATKAFDPGTQDWYGAYLRQYWEPIYATPGQLGGAIWASMDSYNQGPGYNGVNTWGTLLDAWGREKPEYNNVKKEYSPDYIADQAPLDNPGAGQPLLIPIQNRHNNTNLSDVTITYQAGAGADSGTVSADVASGAKGYLTLPAQNWYAGEKVALTFTNSAEAAILATNGITGYNPIEDVYNLTIGQPTPDFTGPTGPAPAITSDASSITVSNNATFSLTFDKATGLISNGTYKGTTVLTGGPILNLGNLAQSNQSLPAWSLSSITTTTSGDEAIVTVAGSYGSTGATFALHIDGTGLIRTTYTVTNPPSGSTEVGVAYEVTGAASTLTWQRRGVWSSYPADNIGRNAGTATEQNPAGPGAYGVRPAWSWSLDQKDYMDFGPNDPGNRGTNDFRGSKTNFITASLVVSGTNERLRAEGDATGSARARIDGANIRFNINNLWSVTNQTPCCNSLFKTYSLPSSYSNTVQMRLTDSDSTHTTTTYEPPTVSPGLNLAPSATVDAPGLNGDARTIQDNDDTTGVPSYDNPTLPQDITYTWTTPQTFNEVLLSTTYAGAQGITNFDVEVSADGRTGWTRVASSGPLTYATNDATVEAKILNFPTQVGMKGLRVTVNSANLIYNHFAIIELKVFNAPPQNLATSATVDALGLRGDAGTIQDNDDSTGTVSYDNPTFPQYITYTWPMPQTFNQVLLSSNYGGGQGVTNFDVEVSADGQTGWTRVASSGPLTYATNDATVEAKTVNFPTQTGMKGVRIRINSANLTYSHFAIVEFKVFDNLAPASAPATCSTATGGSGAQNLAPSATVDAPGLTGDPHTIQDNNDATGVPSYDNPPFPQYITYTWTMPQTVNQVLLSTTYAGGQGITNFDVEVSADGRTGWTQVAASGALTYATNDATVEGKTVDFPTQTGMKGLRIKINNANLEFNHYAIIEFKVFDQPTPTGANICGGLSAPPSPPASVDLTAEGTADWSEWGAASATDFNHKANVPAQIGAFTPVGPGADSQSGGGGAIATWSDGTPTPSGTNSQRGIFVAGAGNGFRLTLPADLVTRTVRLYTNVFAARAAITATLSDGSAPAYSDDALVDASDSFDNGAKAGVYTLSYSAASPGQTLAITLTTETDYGVVGSANQDGGIVLEAATLQQTTAASPTATPSGTAAAIATPSPVATATATVTGTATTGPPVTSTSTNTPISPTATTTVTPTATGTITPATATTTAVPPTATTTSTAVPSTATSTAVPPTMTSTATPVPATATNTAVPPTSTSTAVPPTATNTAASPTSTSTPTPPTVTGTPTALPVCQLYALPAFDIVPRGGNQALLVDAAPGSAITLTVRATYPANATLYTDSSLGSSDGFGVTLTGKSVAGGYRYAFRVEASGLALLTFAIPRAAPQGTVAMQVAAREPCGVFKTITTFQVRGIVRGAGVARATGGAVTLAIALPRGDTLPANASALARWGLLRVTTSGHGTTARRVLRITYHPRPRPAHAVTPSKAGRAPGGR